MFSKIGSLSLLLTSLLIPKVAVGSPLALSELEISTAPKLEPRIAPFATWNAWDTTHDGCSGTPTTSKTEYTSTGCWPVNPSFKQELVVVTEGCFGKTLNALLLDFARFENLEMRKEADTRSLWCSNVLQSVCYLPGARPYSVGIWYMLHWLPVYVCLMCTRRWMSRGMQVAAQIFFFQIGITAIKVFVARKHVLSFK